MSAGIGLDSSALRFLGRRDLTFVSLEDLGIELEQLEGARGRDALAARQAVGDFTLPLSRMPIEDLSVSSGLLSLPDDDGVGGSRGVRQHGGFGNHAAHWALSSRSFRRECSEPGRSCGVFVVGLHPYFNRRARRIEGRADVRDLSRESGTPPGRSDWPRCPR